MKNSTCGNQPEQGFHGNQYVDSQGKHKNSISNTGSGSQTGGKSPGSSSSHGGGNHGNQYVDAQGKPHSKK